jgi:hypothetical protein
MQMRPCRCHLVLHIQSSPDFGYSHILDLTAKTEESEFFELCYESQVCVCITEREVTYFGYTAWDPILQALPALAYIEGLQRYNVTEYKSVFNSPRSRNDAGGDV